MKSMHDIVDCACLIHGDLYDWTYVDKLYNMLTRNFKRPIRLHVYTEATRVVPDPYIKHPLIEWGIKGHKRGWWYKMQLFNPEHHAGPLLYFDLDVVITGKLDWLADQSLRYFWGIRDFKYLQKPHYYSINSSVMWWDTRAFSYVWDDFKVKTLADLIRKYHGDQDYITEVILQEQRRCFNQEKIRSWRWEAVDGGYNFDRREFKTPGTGTKIPPNTSILVFHGDPKPHEIQDPVILQYWQ